MKRIVLAAIFLGICVLAAAQSVVDVCGEYIYYVPEDVTLGQAKQTALQRARLEALVKEFNETVFQRNTSVVSNRNGESSSDFFSIGGSDARGEWIVDTRQPEYDIRYDQEMGMLIVKASVCGKAREIVSSKVAVDTKVLRNGLTPKYESSVFNSGDDMYLYFKSPVSGYVLVYMLDHGNQTVYCLLPYRNSESGNVRVQGDKEYVFFHKDKSQEGWQDVDEYTLVAENPVEWNDLYVIFSPQSLYKVSSKASDDKHIPKELSYKEFVQWIVKCKTQDSEMVINQHTGLKIVK